LPAKKMPDSSTPTSTPSDRSRVATTTTTVASITTEELGVLVGVLLSGIFFAGKVQRMFTVERSVEDGTRTVYKVGGQIFFASVSRFVRAFQPADSARDVVIDVSTAHFWDISGVGALDKIVARLRRDGCSVEVIGYNRASADLIDRFALHDKTGVEMGAVPH
jgi:SulP family sulfate permease